MIDKEALSTILRRFQDRLNDIQFEVDELENTIIDLEDLISEE